MNKSKVLALVLTVFSSSTVLAAGSHDHMHHSGSGNADKAHWMAPPSEAAKKNPIKASVDSIQQGSQLYQQYCVSCHGANADGNGMAGMMLNPAPANLRAMSGTHPDGDFAYKIREGRGAMPAWKDTLKKDQVWHLVNYIQALSKQPAPTKVEDAGDGHSHDHKHTH